MTNLIRRPANIVYGVQDTPLARLPNVDHLTWSFDAGLIVPFAVAAVAASLRALGDVTICQKTNDADWKRPDMASISGGAAANGMGTVIAGVPGGRHPHFGHRPRKSSSRTQASGAWLAFCCGASPIACR